MIFVVGTGRCGTTVLAQMLDRDPRLAAVIEPRFLVFPGGLMDYAVNQAISREEFVENMVKHFRKAMIHNLKRFNTIPDPASIYTPKLIRQIDYRAAASTSDRAVYARLFTKAILQEIRTRLGVSRIVYKAPHLMIWAGYLQWIFPGSTFIHVIRDPRDICASLIPRKWGVDSAADFPAWYNKLMDDAWDGWMNVPQDRYIVISMERMVHQPVYTLHQIYERLGGSKPHHELLTQMGQMVWAGRSHTGRYARDLTEKESRLVMNQCWRNYQKWLDLSIE